MCRSNNLSLIKIITKFFVLISLVACSSIVQASCTYNVISDTGFNFTAEITVENTGSTDVSDWDVTWEYGVSATEGTVNVFGVSDPAFILPYTLSASSPVFSAEPANFNPASPPAHFTLSPGEQVIISVSGGRSGPPFFPPPTASIIPLSLTGALCGPAVASEGLTIEKNITSDNSGTATLDDFDVSFNDGTGATEVSWSDATSVTGGTEVVSTVAGTYTLSELDFSGYAEGVWSCTDDANNSVVPVTNGGLFSGADVVVASGQAVTCSITNDDDAPVIPLPTEVPATVCSVDVNSFDQAAQWTGNGDPFAGVVTGSGATFLSSASPFVPGPGISVNTSNTTAVITGATETNFSDAYMAGDFIDYTIQTIGTSAISRLVENGGRDGTAPYQMDVLVSDDGFATAVSILSNYNVGNTSPFFDFISSADDGLAQLILDAGTQYQFRAVFYGANPSTSNILMDDFAITLDTCPTANLQLAKTWVDGVTDDAITATTTGLTNNATISSISTGANTDTGSPVVVTIGETATLPTETFDVGSAGDYITSDWQCDDSENSLVPAGDDLEILAADAGEMITCTVTNTLTPVTRIRFIKELIPAQTWTKTFRYYVSPTNAAYSGSPGGDYVLVDALARPNGNIQDGEITDWVDVVPGTTIGIAEDSPGSTLGSATDVFYNCQDINGLLDQDEASMIGASRPFDAAVFSLNVPVTSMANDITCTVSNVRQLLLNIDDVEVVEGDPGDDRNLVFTVSHNSLIPLPQDTIVTYSITNLTTDGADYTPPAVLSVTIPAGSLSTTLTIPVNEDLDNEADETFRIRLLTTTNGLTQGAVRDGIGTIINDDASGELTIVKIVINDQGGSAVVDDFTVQTDAGDLTFDSVTTVGNTTTYTANALTVDADTYQFSEQDLPGYTEGSWSCTGNTGTVVGTFSNGSVEIASGEDVTCSITNDDIGSLITLVKQVNNSANGGSAVANDWTLEANIGGGSAEVSGTSGVSQSINAGDYVLSEINGPNGYIMTDLSCDDGTLTGDTLTVDVGEDITCTFTNRDLITDLQITKTASDLNPSIGDIVTFTLTVVNNGPDDATNIVIDDTVLAGFSFEAGSMTGGDSQNQAAPNLQWVINNLSALAPDNVVTLTYQTTVIGP